MWKFVSSSFNRQVVNKHQGRTNTALSDCRQEMASFNPSISIDKLSLLVSLHFLSCWLGEVVLLSRQSIFDSLCAGILVGGKAKRPKGKKRQKRSQENWGEGKSGRITQVVGMATSILCQQALPHPSSLSLFALCPFSPYSPLESLLTC